MNQTVTLELPQHTLTSAQEVARQTKRRVEDVLVEWIDRAAAETPVEMLPDEQLLALCRLQLEPAQQARLSELQQKNNEGTLTASEQADLDGLMDIYSRQLIRKSQAIKTAVARKLIPPLHA